MAFLPSHCIHQPQVSLCANLSWPFILKKSSSISRLLNYCCAFHTSFFSVCLIHLIFFLLLASHPSLFLPSPVCIRSPLLPAQQGGWGGRVLPEHLPEAAPSPDSAKRICPLYYSIFSMICLNVGGNEGVLQSSLWKLGRGNATCPLTMMFWPRTDILHQEKVQEGIYTALEIWDSFYTESNLMLQLIFSSIQDWKPIIILLINREC